MEVDLPYVLLPSRVDWSVFVTCGLLANRLAVAVFF